MKFEQFFEMKIEKEYNEGASGIIDELVKDFADFLKQACKETWEAAQKENLEQNHSAIAKNNIQRSAIALWREALRCWHIPMNMHQWFQSNYNKIMKICEDNDTQQTTGT